MWTLSAKRQNEIQDVFQKQCQRQVVENQGKQGYQGSGNNQGYKKNQILLA